MRTRAFARRAFHPAFPAAVVLVLAGLSPAQTFVLDSRNGPGTDFTDLAPAITAVPSGATLLVRPGSYGAFSIASKSLTIVGQRSASGELPVVRPRFPYPGISLGPTAASQPISITGLRFSEASASTPSAFTVDGCAGPVLLDDIEVVFQAEFVLRITGSPSVHVARTLVSAFVVVGPTPNSTPIVVRGSSVEFSRLSVAGYRQTGSALGGTAALTIMDQSRVVLVDSRVTGGAGLTSGTAGGSGIALRDGSTLHAWANAATGVTSGIEGGSAPTTGGHGLEVHQGSFARVRGTTLTGGFAFGFGGTNGQPFLKTSGTVDYDPIDVAPSGSLTGVVQPGSLVRYTLHARPGSHAWMFLGLDPAFVPSPALTLGAVGIAAPAVLTLGTVPASGRLEVPSVVPPGWPTATVVLAQFAVFSPARGELSVSNLFTATSRF